MTAPLTCGALLLGAAPSASSSSIRATAAPVSIAASSGNVSDLRVLAIARRCLDAHHVALVSNALRHNRSVTVVQARSWCG